MIIIRRRGKHKNDSVYSYVAKYTCLESKAKNGTGVAFMTR